jgi:hypothetical protein
VFVNRHVARVANLDASYLCCPKARIAVGFSLHLLTDMWLELRISGRLSFSGEWSIYRTICGSTMLFIVSHDPSMAVELLMKPSAMSVIVSKKTASMVIILLVAGSSPSVMDSEVCYLRHSSFSSSQVHYLPKNDSRILPLVALSSGDP